MIKSYIKKKLGLLLWVETQKMIARGNNEDIIKKITEVYALHLKSWQQFDRLLELHKKNVKITLIDNIKCFGPLASAGGKRIPSRLSVGLASAAWRERRYLRRKPDGSS